MTQSDEKSFKGNWFITEMEAWDKDFTDLEEERYFLIGTTIQKNSSSVS
jgi:hypothetical protein